jgi:type I restriction enzyme S subunit
MTPGTHTPLGAILERVSEPIAINALETYRTIGIRAFGKGIFHYDPVDGSALSKLRWFKVRPGELVVSNIKGWEGAIAVSSEADAGCIASNRFLTYKPKDGSTDINYVRYFLLSEQGLRLIRKASPGSTDRNLTLGIKAFEALKIPLPSIELQRERVSRLEAIVHRARDGIRRVSRVNLQGALLIEAIIRQRFDLGVARGWLLQPLGDIAEISPTPVRLGPDVPISFVPMSAVDGTTGRIVRPEVRTMRDLNSGYKQFRRDDVIFARITPCMQNGKTAMGDDLPTEYGYGSTEFHVIRPGETVTATWLHQIFRTATFKAEAARHFAGTAGQQRVPASFLREVVVPVPSVEDQRSVVARLDLISQKGRELAKCHAGQDARFRALEASVLNETMESPP